MENTFSPESSTEESQMFKEVTIGDKKTHICLFNDCGKEFRYKSDMARHLTVHVKERPHPCTFPGCNKTFKRIDTLANHIRMHNTELSFTCTMEGCGLQFTNKAALKYHVLKHEGQSRFKCSIPGCDRVFITAGQLKQHEKATFYHQNKGPNSQEANKEIIHEKPEEVKPTLSVKEESNDSQSHTSSRSEPYKQLKTEETVNTAPLSPNKVDMVENLVMKDEEIAQITSAQPTTSVEAKLTAMLKNLAEENKMLKSQLQNKFVATTNNINTGLGAFPANMDLYGFMLAGMAHQRMAALQQYNLSM